MLILNDKNIKKTIVEHFAVDLTYSYHLVDCVGRAIAAKGPSMTSLQVTIFDLANYFCCDSAFCFVKNLKKLNQTKLCDDQIAFYRGIVSPRHSCFAHLLLSSGTA